MAHPRQRVAQELRAGDVDVLAVAGVKDHLLGVAVLVAHAQVIAEGHRASWRRLLHEASGAAVDGKPVGADFAIVDLLPVLGFVEKSPRPDPRLGGARPRPGPPCRGRSPARPPGLHRGRRRRCGPALDQHAGDAFGVQASSATARLRRPSGLAGVRRTSTPWVGGARRSLVSPKIVIGTRSAVCSTARGGECGSLASSTTRRGEAIFQARQPAGEIGVVVGDRLAADQDGVGPRPQEVGVLARLRPRDPARRAVAARDQAVPETAIFSCTKGRSLVMRRSGRPPSSVPPPRTGRPRGRRRHRAARRSRGRRSRDWGPGRRTPRGGCRR